MARRSLATLLTFAVTLWASVPALARVECRPGYAHCAKCPRPKLAPGHDALKVDCCIVHAELERARAVPAHAHAELSADLPLALDQSLPGMAHATGWAVIGFTADPSPPPIQHNRPLLR